MREDIAKTKWCPFYQVATSGGDSSTYEMDNRPPHYEPGDPVGHGRTESEAISDLLLAEEALED